MLDLIKNKMFYSRHYMMVDEKDAKIEKLFINEKNKNSYTLRTLLDTTLTKRRCYFAIGKLNFSASL